MAKSYRDTVPISMLRHLVRAHQNVFMWAETEMERADLPGSELDVLLTLGNTNGMRMCELAAKMLTSAPNVTRLVKCVESKGLVKRQRSTASERDVIARLTPKGEEIFADVYPKVYQFWKRKFDALLSKDEQKQLLALLEKITADANGAP